MPILQLYTTLPRNKVPSDFKQKTCQLLTQVLRDKPLETITVHLFTDQDIYNSSDPNGNEPNAYGILRSIGSVRPEDNRLTIDELAQHVKRELGVSVGKFILFFLDVDPNMIGYKGKLGKDHGL
ncbi:D-dopachrome decarboxylase-like [Oppia nitens]|uniref:D-dopachrome decarboxylase-like n=1 Tax=Oppia nitens TaxID=1686743 RepID=UPI0023DAFE1B|nr:D-dopachrome decarboxylase-like [Oppia nitens]